MKISKYVNCGQCQKIVHVQIDANKLDNFICQQCYRDNAMTDAENTKRESIPLTPEQWAALERIAAETNSTADRGPTTGQPSWRALLRRIADGELIVTEKAE